MRPLDRSARRGRRQRRWSQTPSEVGGEQGEAAEDDAAAPVATAFVAARMNGKSPQISGTRRASAHRSTSWPPSEGAGWRGPRHFPGGQCRAPGSVCRGFGRAALRVDMGAGWWRCRITVIAAYPPEMASSAPTIVAHQTSHAVTCQLGRAARAWAGQLWGCGECHLDRRAGTGSLRGDLIETPGRTLAADHPHFASILPDLTAEAAQRNPPRSRLPSENPGGHSAR